MKKKNEKQISRRKLRGVYRSVICLNCGKTIPTHPEIMPFICDDCIKLNTETEFTDFSENLERIRSEKEKPWRSEISEKGYDV